MQLIAVDNLITLTHFAGDLRTYSHSHALPPAMSILTHIRIRLCRNIYFLLYHLLLSSFLKKDCRETVHVIHRLARRLRWSTVFLKVRDLLIITCDRVVRGYVNLGSSKAESLSSLMLTQSHITTLKLPILSQIHPQAQASYQSTVGRSEQYMYTYTYV